jgi:DNA-binding PadR family transcriptional regulator
MTDDVLLGTLEHLILLAVLALSAEAYGMTIRDEIHSRAAATCRLARSTVTLQRLEAKGMVTGRWPHRRRSVEAVRSGSSG